MARMIFVLLATAMVTHASFLSEYCGAPVAKAFPPVEGASLRQVHVVNRHGDRAPVMGWQYNWTLFPPPAFTCDAGLYDGIRPDPSATNPVGPRLVRIRIPEGGNTALPGNCTIGQLTRKGSLQLYNLGKSLREVYIDEYGFLPQNYTQATDRYTQWFGSSCSADRCIQSLESLLLGLYPDENVHSANPFTIITDEGPKDPMNPPYVCQNFDKFLSNFTNSTEWLTYNATIVQPVLAQVAKELGQGTTISDIQWMSWNGGALDSFGCVFCHNTPFPGGVTFPTADQAAEVGAEFFNHIFQSPAGRHTFAGPLLSRIYTALEQAVAKTSDVKYYQWSGHDTSVQSILSAFGYAHRWPPYASYLAFELWQEDASGDYKVRTIYNQELVPLLGSADGVISWSEFLSLKADVAPSNWHKLCQY